MATPVIGTLEPWWWRYGLPSPIWITNLGLIQQVIEQHRIAPLTEKQMPAMQLAPPDAQVEAAALKPGGIRGGMRIPHLHFEGRVYPLNREQWQEFSGQVLEGLRKNLRSAKAVSFPQLLELSEAIETL